MPEALLTVEEFATRTHQHAQTVRRQIRRGAVPTVRTGRKYLIPESALKAPSIEAAAPSSQGQSGPLYPSPFPIGAEAEEADLTALLAPPTPAEIAHRLAALDSIRNGAISRAPGVPILDLGADPWGYEERADTLRESRQ